MSGSPPSRSPLDTYENPLTSRYASPEMSAKRAKATGLIQAGYLEAASGPDRLRLTPKGFALSDQVISALA